MTLTFVWSWLDGGYPATTWYAGGLIVGGLLIVQFAGGAMNLGRSAATAACAFLGAFGLFQLVSILWADAKGDAWDAANRTFLYAFVFLLFVGWRATPQARQALILFFAFGMAVIGVATLFSAANHVGSAFESERLSTPTGYANATAALFLIPFWAVVAIGGTPRLPPPLRAIAVGTAATLAAVAYVPESRGALYSFPIAAAILLLLARHRVRTTIALALSIAPVALLIHPLSRPFEAATASTRATATHHAALVAIVCGVVAAVAAAAAALLDDRVRLETPRWLRIATCAIVAVAVLTAVTAVAVDHPRSQASRLWSSFRSDNRAQTTGTRFGTLGSNRYDFWRVALNLADDHPIGGVGAGNFSEQYLQQRRTDEQPAYPHSLEMSLLAQTGAIGTALFLAFACAVGLAAYRRRKEGPAGATLSRRLRLGAVALCSVVTLSFVAPWIAARQVARAGDVWRQDPGGAYATLDQAADLNPLSDAAPVLAGTIAAQRGEVARMRHSFERAISRDSHNWFSHTQLAVALANEGDWQAAARSVDVAAELNPREPVIQEVERAIRRRKSLRPDAVNRAVSLELQALPGTAQ